jgi:hypothetical protein
MTKRKEHQAGSHELASCEPTPQLTYKQSLFVEHYISNKGNATAAYRLAFGGTDNTCRNEGSKLLANPCIQEVIERRREQTATALAFDREEWLRILIGMARCDSVTVSAVRSGEVDASEIGDLKYGLDCKASDRKAALDELRDALGFKVGTDTVVSESTASRLLRRIKEGRAS